MRARVPHRYVRPVRDWDYLLDVMLARPGIYVGLPSFVHLRALLSEFRASEKDATR